MYAMIKNLTKCKSCGNCDALLPGLTEYFQEHNQLIISSTSLSEHACQIGQAIDHCIPQALSLQSLN